MKLLLILSFLVSCSSLTGQPKEGKTIFSYTDVGGNFKLSRESLLIKKKIVTRQQLIDSKGSGEKVVEKSIIVSQIGSIRGKSSRLITVRPYASEFTVWLEGKKYASRMELNSKNKSMRIIMDSPEKKWQGTQEVRFPKGKYFCFYGQIPECLYHNSLLVQANTYRSQKFEFYMIWDGYPYIQDQLTGVGKNLFAQASLKFDGEINGQFRYSVEVEGQLLLYHFTKSFDLRKVAWIAQGITVVPPGEEVADDE